MCIACTALSPISTDHITALAATHLAPDGIPLSYEGATFEIAVLVLSHDNGFAVELADLSVRREVLAEVHVTAMSVTVKRA